jgi:hypothetical protein
MTEKENPYNGLGRAVLPVRPAAATWRTRLQVPPRCPTRRSPVFPKALTYGIHRFDSVIGIFCALRQESVGKILRFPEAFTM